MTMPIRINEVLYKQARMYAKTEHRTISGQIEFWASVGRTALDNPDLPIDFVSDLLIARAEDVSLATPFVPEGKHGYQLKTGQEILTNPRHTGRNAGIQCHGW